MNILNYLYAQDVEQQSSGQQVGSREVIENEFVANAISVAKETIETQVEGLGLVLQTVH